MSDSLVLTVPDEHKTAETIKRYYHHYFERTKEYVDNESPEEMTAYQHTLETFSERGSFHIHESLDTKIANHCEPSVPEIYCTYGDEEDVLIDYPYGLAKLAQSFDRARQRLASEGTLSVYDERDIDAHIALIDFAMENGYAISYAW